MKAHVQPFGIQPPQPVRAALPGRRADQAADSVHPPHAGQPQCRVIDTCMEAEVVHAEADHSGPALLANSARLGT